MEKLHYSCHGIRTAPKQSALPSGCMEDDRTPYYTLETCLMPAIHGRLNSS